MNLSKWAAALGLAAAALAAAPASAQPYPSKRLDWTIAFGPGGGNDIMSRTLISILEKYKLYPETIVADVSHLEIGDYVRAGDLPLPSGVKLVSDANVVIAHCVQPKAEEEPKPAEAAAEGAAAPAAEAGAKPEAAPAKEGREGKDKKEGKD